MELTPFTEINKLVRDEIPLIIEQNNEIAIIQKLSGEALLTALQRKLIEEAFEAASIHDPKLIIHELADINEVIDAILNQIGITKTELEEIQKRKREKAGAFKKGIFLIGTKHK